MGLNYTLNGYTRDQIEANPEIFRELLALRGPEYGHDLNVPIYLEESEIYQIIQESPRQTDQQFLENFGYGSYDFALAGMSREDIASLYTEAGAYILSKDIGRATNGVMYGLLRGNNSLVDDIAQSTPADLYSMFNDEINPNNTNNPVSVAKSMAEVLSVHRAADVINGVEPSTAADLIERLETLDAFNGNTSFHYREQVNETYQHVSEVLTQLEEQCPGIAASIAENLTDVGQLIEIDPEDIQNCSLPNNPTERNLGR